MKEQEKLEVSPVDDEMNDLFLEKKP